MKKITSFIIAIILFFIIIYGYNISLSNQIREYENELYYLLHDFKFNSIEAAETCLENGKNTILVLGSSELSGFNTEIFSEGNSNFNMYLVGRGHTQCLQSALTLGAIEEKVNINKVVLIISPQWFQTTDVLNSEIFASRFQKNTFNVLLKNNKISISTKQEIIDRLKTLEISDEIQLEKIKKYEKAYLKNNIMDKIYLEIIDNVENTKQKMKLIDLLKNSELKKVSKEKIRFENYDFNELLNEKTKTAKIVCTNNDFEIDNDYYNTYVKENLVNSKNSKSSEDFSNSTEYGDLEIFLKLCKEINIQPLIINVPVNGRWYDYVGVTKENRKSYYDRIKNIAQKYNAKIADFSECEYEKYFLKDIMHIGWRGWIKVDESIYSYCNE